MFGNLRPTAAATVLGISLSTFWRRSKEDPDFPPVIRLSPRCAVVREEDLAAYMAKKAEQSVAATRRAAVAVEERC